MTDTPQWNACIEYFRHQFSGCRQCQSGHDSIEELMTHLSVSHYKQEALTAFGQGPKCPQCATVLNIQKESQREHYILSHMSLHISTFATGFAKHFLNMVMETEYENDKYDKISQGSPGKPVTSLEETNTLGISSNSLKTEESSNGSHLNKRSNPLYWKDCENFLRTQFPRCLLCKAGFNVLYKLKRHVVLVHYSDEAIRQFGKGDMCGICQDFKLPKNTPSKVFKHLMKIHMITHFELTIPQKAREHFVNAFQETKNINLRLNNPLWQECAEYLRKRHTKCKICQTGFKNPSKMRYHFVTVHCGDRVLQLFGTGKTCAVCKTFTAKQTLDRGPIKQHMAMEHFELTFPEEAKHIFIKAMEQKTKPLYVGDISDPEWQECMKYLRETYPKCRSCQASFKAPSSLLDHLICMHYKNVAYRQFGSGNNCAICNDFALPLADKPGETMHPHLIPRHMKNHLEGLFSAEARRVFGKVLDFNKSNSDASSKQPKIDNVVQDEELPNRQHPCRLDENPTKTLQEVSNMTTGRRMSNIWWECLQHFRVKFSQCHTCQQDHKNIASLKLHLTKTHFGRSAIELFGNGPDCPICDKSVLPCAIGSTKIVKEKEAIKTHMSLHLDEFIVGKAKSILQKATEIMPKFDLEECNQINGNVEGSLSRKSKPLSVKCRISRKQKNNTGSIESWRRISNPLWQDCEMYFKNKYKFCETCNKGHKTPSILKAHISTMHYKELAIRYFGPGNNCNVCKRHSLPPNVAKAYRNHYIKAHMGIHLESFIPDDQARSLLLKAKKSFKDKMGKKLSNTEEKQTAENTNMTSGRPNSMSTFNEFQSNTSSSQPQGSVCGEFVDVNVPGMKVESTSSCLENNLDLIEHVDTNEVEGDDDQYETNVTMIM